MISERIFILLEYSERNYRNGVTMTIVGTGRTSRKIENKVALHKFAKTGTNEETITTTDRMPMDQKYEAQQTGQR